ncbi:MAG: hypothetical protein ACR2NP_21765 [Pirellulaceae bacterium]
MSFSSKTSNGNSPQVAGDTKFRHLAPHGQPESVHEVSEALYKPFRNSELGLHLSGCHIDPVAFVQTAAGDYTLLNGETVAPEYARTLGFEQLDAMEQPPVIWQTDENRETILEQLDTLKLNVPLAPANSGRQTIIWCNHVHGTLTAAAGESSVDIPFSLWGVRLINGVEQCPAWHCPIADIDTWTLAIDDDGTISDAGQILTCSETGKRLLRQKLEACQVSGKLYEPSVLMTCPVTGNRLLNRLAGECAECHQRVDPSVLGRGRCHSCRNLASTTLEHPFFDQLAERYECVARARKLRIAEQPDQWQVQWTLGGKPWRIVFDKITLEAVSVARSRGWLRGWSRLDQQDWPAFLRPGPST